jgi:hypothetical protein
MSAAVTTARAVSSQRISRDRHATERDRGSDSDDCFVINGSNLICRAILRFDSRDGKARA